MERTCAGGNTSAMAAVASPSPRARTAGARSPAPAPELDGFDHVEWWVGNARHAAHFFASGFGFDVVAHAGPETGVRDRTSYVLAAGRHLLRGRRSTLHRRTPTSPRHVARHGDGVRVRRLPGRRRRARRTPRDVARGGRSAPRPTRRADEHGHVVLASIAALRRHRPHARRARRLSGRLPPGLRSPPTLATDARPPVGLDTLRPRRRQRRARASSPSGSPGTSGVGTAPTAALQRGSDRDRVLGAALDRRVGRRVASCSRSTSRHRAAARVRSRSTSSTTRGPGVQHLALRTDDIVATVRRAARPRHPPAAACRRRTTTKRRRGWSGSTPSCRGNELAELGILVDRDDQGYLLQVFTENVASRPTVFCEIIQREGVAASARATSRRCSSRSRPSRHDAGTSAWSPCATPRGTF